MIPAYDKGAGTVPGNNFHLGQGVLDGDRIGPESGVHVSIGQVVFQYLVQGDMPGEAGENSPNPLEILCLNHAGQLLSGEPAISVILEYSLIKGFALGTALTVGDEPVKVLLGVAD